MGKKLLGTNRISHFLFQEHFKESSVTSTRGQIVDIRCGFPRPRPRLGAERGRGVRQKRQTPEDDFWRREIPVLAQSRSPGVYGGVGGDVKLTGKVFLTIESRGGEGSGSDAIIGIVVACVGVLLIVVGSVIVYMVCRMRKRAAKNTSPTNHEPQSPHEGGGGGGQALPVDIPVESVNRIPPPSYAPLYQSQGHRPPRPSVNGQRTSRSRRPASNGTGLPPPPPYSAVTGTVATIDISRDEAPPEYRSRLGLNNSATAVGDEPPRNNPNPLSISVNSFTEYPSMRNILLTSSRSSLQGTDSRQASQSDRSSAGEARTRSGASQRLSAGDSARGDSVESDPTNLRQTHRSISTSSSALYDPRMSVPEGGLQRKVRRSKQQSESQSRTAVEPTMTTALNRSCPSLVSDDTDPPSEGRNGVGRGTTSTARQAGNRRPRDEAAEADNITLASESQRQRRYRRKQGSTKTQRRPSSTEYSDDGSKSSGTSVLTNGEPSAPGTRFQIAGTCEV